MDGPIADVQRSFHTLLDIWSGITQAILVKAVLTQSYDKHNLGLCLFVVQQGPTPNTLFKPQCETILRLLLTTTSKSQMARSSEYYFKEGCFIEEWHNTEQDPDCSIARVRVEAGNTTKLHALKNTTERYVMLGGSGMVTVGDKSWQVREGDVIVIQPDQAQKIENLNQRDLIFLAICTPRFKVENYREC